MGSPLTGQQLYELTSKLLLGYQMDQTLFYQLLLLAQGTREQMRPWVILRSEDATQQANPQQNTINNSMYLTPFNIPTGFLNFYSPDRSLVLVANDGITLRFYTQIPIERKQEYMQDSSVFYVDYPNNKIYLCGLLDQQYTIHQFFVKNSTAISAGTSWIFPNQFHPILAYDIAMNYKLYFDYDVVNAQQGEMIANGAAFIFAQMAEWDDKLQERLGDGVDYGPLATRPAFQSKVVGDNDY